MREFLEANDVARALQISPSTVRVLVADGRLMPRARTRRGIALYDPADVQRLRHERELRRETRHAD